MRSKGVQPAQRNVELALVIAKLVDRSGEPLGDLPFPVHL
jgi:hypothetical protein